MPGHTGGDTVAYDAESDVVFCGDLFWESHVAQSDRRIHEGNGSWTLDTLVKDYPSAVFVPGQWGQSR